MNRHGLKVFKLEYKDETYYIASETQEDAIQHLFVNHLDEMNPTGKMEANEFPKEEWAGFTIDFTHDLGEEDADRFQSMSEFMEGVTETEIVASSEYF